MDHLASRLRSFPPSQKAGPHLFFLLPALMLLAWLSACAPLSPEDDGGGGPAGSTTDKFMITAWELRDGVPVDPIPVAEVQVDFVDQDHIDPETGSQIIRRHRRGFTNSAGYYEVTVTYDGAGEFAADKVIFRVTHERFHAYGNTLPIVNHKVTAHAEMEPRPTR